MVRRKVFNVLLLISFCYELYMLLTISHGVANYYNASYIVSRPELTLNAVYWIFLMLCGLYGYWYVSIPIVGLACLRDFLLVPKHWFNVWTAAADSVICLILIVLVFIKEYKRAQKEW